MEGWDADYFDMEVEAFIEFDRGGRGRFQFGLVQGWIDYRVTKRDGRPLIEWSWDGADENDPASGRGWAVRAGPQELTGRIFIHCGDDSSFTARRA